MAPRKSGSIVNVSSSGIDTPYPGLSVYGMTKSVTGRSGWIATDELFAEAVR